MPSLASRCSPIGSLTLSARDVVAIPHRRFVSFRGSVRLVEHRHYRQPFVIRQRRRNLRARVLPCRPLLLAAPLRRSVGRIAAGLLEHAVEGSFPNAGAVRGKIAEPFEFGAGQVGDKGKPHKDVGGILGIGAVDCLLRRGIVELQLVGRAAMRKTVYP